MLWPFVIRDVSKKILLSPLIHEVIWLGAIKRFPMELFCKPFSSLIIIHTKITVEKHCSIAKYIVYKVTSVTYTYNFCFTVVIIMIVT